MKPADHKLKPHLLLTIIVVAVVALVGTMVLTTAKSSSSGKNITVRNNSQRAILHLYLAAGDPNNWSADQLNGGTIQSGASHTLSDVACSGATIRVIAEDQNGCFVYYDAACNADQTWEITDNTPRDCGD
jgi:hypothetical protein